MSIVRYKILKPGESIDLTASKEVITEVYVDGLIGKFALRWIGGGTGNDFASISSGVVYAATNEACITTAPAFVLGRYDKAYNSSAATTSIKLKIEPVRV